MGLQGRHHLRLQAGRSIQLECVRRGEHRFLRGGRGQRRGLYRVLCLSGLPGVLQRGTDLQGLRGQAQQLPGNEQRVPGGGGGQPCQSRHCGGDAVLSEPGGGGGLLRRYPAERRRPLRDRPLPQRRGGQRRGEVLRLPGGRHRRAHPLCLRHPKGRVAQGGQPGGRGLRVGHGAVLPGGGRQAVAQRKHPHRTGGRRAGGRGGEHGGVC